MPKRKPNQDTHSAQVEYLSHLRDYIRETEGSNRAMVLPPSEGEYDRDANWGRDESEEDYPDANWAEHVIQFNDLPGVERGDAVRGKYNYSDTSQPYTTKKYGQGSHKGQLTKNPYDASNHTQHENEALERRKQGANPPMPEHLQPKPWEKKPKSGLSQALDVATRNLSQVIKDFGSAAPAGAMTADSVHTNAIGSPRGNRYKEPKRTQLGGRSKDSFAR